MKRLIIAITIAVSLAVAIGLLAYYFGPGYVAISFAETSIETSFIFATGFIAISFFLFHYLIRILSIFFRIPDYLGLRHSNRQAEKARNALVKGLIEMSEGRFQQAEKILIKQVEHSDTGLLNYLMAARSAQQLSAYERRDEYLRLAHESTPSADIAIGITQAELQLAHKQYEQALATLNYLTSISPKHGYVKKLQARVYQQLNDWESLGKLITQVRKQRLLSDDKLQEIELQTYSGMLTKSINKKDLAETQAIWKKIPKQLKTNTNLLQIYIRYLISSDINDEAEAILRSYLNSHWRESMVKLYSQITSSNLHNQLESAESWLRQHHRSPVLLLVLGHLCIKMKLWGKAKNYLETSLSIKPLSEAYLELAQLLEDHMEEQDKAHEYYRKGLKLAASESRQNNLQKIDSAGYLFKERSGKTPYLKLIQ